MEMICSRVFGVARASLPLSLSLSAFLFTCLFPVAAFAQAYPTRSVTMIVPSTTGTAHDLVARLISPIFSQRMGQAFVVDNKPGASGNVGAALVAKAAPDGHTLMMGAAIFSIVPAFQKDMPFDPVADFAPVGTSAKLTMVLVVHPSVAATSIAQFVALAKARPGLLNYGSPGNGSPQHVAMELLRLQTATNVVHVPYKGNAGLVTGLIAGDVQAGFLTLLTSMPLAQGGKLRLLAVMGTERSTLTSDVPTFKEAGIGEMEGDQWLAMFAPARTPPEIVRRLNQELALAINQPATREQMAKQGLFPYLGTPEDLAVLLKKELARNKDVVTKAGLKAD